MDIEEAGENEMKETEDDHLPGFNVLTIKSPSSFPDGINFIVLMLNCTFEGWMTTIQPSNVEE